MNSSYKDQIPQRLKKWCVKPILREVRHYESFYENRALKKAYFYGLFYGFCICFIMIVGLELIDSAIPKFKEKPTVRIISFGNVEVDIPHHLKFNDAIYDADNGKLTIHIKEKTNEG